ncbi:MAG: hypothetical protein MZV70_37925 [Desulfobacterales bacterium]|nr:hypothetical protein [Desulfobacterales bacterium]
MKKTTWTICFALALGLAQAAVLAVSAQDRPGTDESLYREAKLLVFDKSWKAALDKLDELTDKFPESPLAGQALFYKGECLSGLGGRERDALRAYKGYIRLDDAKPSLVEESEGSIVDLAFDLYEDGDAAAIRDVESRLDHGNKVVRYYAAYKLSLVADKKLGGQGRARPDEDRRVREGPRAPRPGPDRPPARLAREPEVRRRRGLPGPARPGCSGSAIRKAGMKEPAFSLNIPFALADLALERHGRGRQGGHAQEGLRPQQDHERAGQVQGEHPPHRGRRRHGHRDLDRLTTKPRRTNMKRTIIALIAVLAVTVLAGPVDRRERQRLQDHPEGRQAESGLRGGEGSPLVQGPDRGRQVERGQGQGDPAHRPDRAHPELRCGAPRQDRRATGARST